MLLNLTKCSTKRLRLTETELSQFSVTKWTTILTQLQACTTAELRTSTSERIILLLKTKNSRRLRANFSANCSKLTTRRNKWRLTSTKLIRRALSELNPLSRFDHESKVCTNTY